MYYLWGKRSEQDKPTLIDQSDNLRKLVYNAEKSLVQTRLFKICTIEDSNKKLIWESTEHMLLHTVPDIQELATIQLEEAYQESFDSIGLE